jgi:hypothetical protein
MLSFGFLQIVFGSETENLTILGLKKLEVSVDDENSYTNETYPKYSPSSEKYYIVPVGNGYDEAFSFNVKYIRSAPSDLSIFEYGSGPRLHKPRSALPYTQEVYSTPKSFLYVDGKYLTIGLRGLKGAAYPYDWVKIYPGASLQNITLTRPFLHDFTQNIGEWVNVVFHPELKLMYVNGVKIDSNRDVNSYKPGWKFWSEINGYDYRKNASGEWERYIKYPASPQLGILEFPDSDYHLIESVQFLQNLDGDVDKSLHQFSVLQSYLLRSNKDISEVVLDADSDGDGVSNHDEIFTLGSDPFLLDTDGDALNDLTDPSPLDYNIDHDGDGLTNTFEIQLGINPLRHDTDYDGMTDNWEHSYGLDPKKNNRYHDYDSDGMLDVEEFWFQSDPTNEDTDGDGMLDGYEIGYNVKIPEDGVIDGVDFLSYLTSYVGPSINPYMVWMESGRKSFLKSYGLSFEIYDATQLSRYYIENSSWTTISPLNPPSQRPYEFDQIAKAFVRYSTDWTISSSTNENSDKFNFPRGSSTLRKTSTGKVEIIKGEWLKYKPLVLVDDANDDSDKDGLTNIEEFKLGTHPKIADTDFDGLSDLWEFSHGYDPKDFNSGPSQDFDDDGLTNIFEINENLNPLSIDSDGDGMSDGWEINNGLNPLSFKDRDQDVDQDLASNFTEFTMGTNPKIFDTDGDSLPDGWEISLRLDAIKEDNRLGDINEDGLTNLEEYELGLSPGYYSSKDDSFKYALDSDSDGLSNFDEVKNYGTNPRLVDTDGDGMRDEDEVHFSFDPLNANDGYEDADNDGLSNSSEVGTRNSNRFTSPHNSDSDSDGFDDGWEVKYYRIGMRAWKENQKNDDFDKDGLSNFEEYSIGTFPDKLDSDNDGIPDKWEYLNGLNALSSNDRDTDLDSDNLSNYEEYTHSTNPNEPDSDHDGMNDGDEVANGLNPSNKSDSELDSDQDGLKNSEEITLGTNPQKYDTDEDGMDDGWEFLNGLDPLTDDSLKDKDADDLNNLSEYTHGSDPNKEDTDNDGMPDYWEVANNLLPRVVDGQDDYDQDGLNNFLEYSLGTKANDVDSDGDSLPDNWEIENSLDPLSKDDVSSDVDKDGLTALEEFELSTNPLRFDTDEDKLPDGWESSYELNPLTDDANEDRDLDGLTNIQEYRIGSDPSNSDSDGDLMPDLWEYENNQSVNSVENKYLDTDNDGLVTYEEFLLGTSPFSKDTDLDGLPDGWEVRFSLNPQFDDSFADSDLDGLSNVQEYSFNTNPTLSDTDGDGLLDPLEINYGLNPLLNSDAALDRDGDGLSNLTEIFLGTNLSLLDTDGDNLPDGWESNYNLDPLDANDSLVDTDGDGLINQIEFTKNTSPRNRDTDKDGINDLVEVNFNLNPNDPLDAELDIDNDGLNARDETAWGTDLLLEDTDSDGLPDGWEVQNKKNPLIKDRNIPSISLAGADFIVVSDGVYKEEGAFAFDEYDGNLSRQINISKPQNFSLDINGTYEISYSVSNSSGQTNSVYRTIIVTDQIDEEPPELVSNSRIKQIEGMGNYTFILYEDGRLGRLGNASSNSWQIYDEKTGQDINRFHGYLYANRFDWVTSGVKHISGSTGGGDAIWVDYADEKNVVNHSYRGQLRQKIGPYSLLILKEDSSLWGLGFSFDGRLGLGDQSGYIENPQLIVESGVVDMDCYRRHSVFLKDDGSLWAMGYGWTDSPLLVPQKIHDSNVTQAHLDHSYSGNLYYSVGNSKHLVFGLDDSPSYSPRTPAERDVSRIIDYSHSLANSDQIKSLIRVHWGAAYLDNENNLFYRNSHAAGLLNLNTSNDYVKIAQDVVRISRTVPFVIEDSKGQLWTQKFEDNNGKWLMSEAIPLNEKLKLRSISRFNTDLYNDHRNNFIVEDSQLIELFNYERAFTQIADNCFFTKDFFVKIDQYSNKWPLKVDRAGISWMDTGISENVRFIEKNEFAEIFEEKVYANDENDGNITDDIITEVFEYVFTEDDLNYSSLYYRSYLDYLNAVRNFGDAKLLKLYEPPPNPKCGLYLTRHSVEDSSGNTKSIETQWFVGRRLNNNRPLLTLNWNNENFAESKMVHLPNQKVETLEELDLIYNDPGCKATDLEDGDLSRFVKRTLYLDENSSSDAEFKYYGVLKPNEAVIFYSVEDSDRELTISSRKLSFEGSEIPEIELLGDSQIKLQIGTKYVEEGALAFDRQDGNLTDSITYTNEHINPFLSNHYKINYSVTDSSYFKNSNSVERSIEFFESNISSELLNRPEWDAEIVHTDIVSSCSLNYGSGTKNLVVYNTGLLVEIDDQNITFEVLSNVHQVVSIGNAAYILLKNGNCMIYKGKNIPLEKRFTNCIDVSAHKIAWNSWQINFLSANGELWRSHSIDEPAEKVGDDIKSISGNFLLRSDGTIQKDISGPVIQHNFDDITDISLQNGILILIRGAQITYVNLGSDLVINEENSLTLMCSTNDLPSVNKAGVPHLLSDGSIFEFGFVPRLVLKGANDTRSILPHEMIGRIFNETDIAANDLLLKSDNIKALDMGKPYDLYSIKTGNLDSFSKVEPNIKVFNDLYERSKSFDQSHLNKIDSRGYVRSFLDESGRLYLIFMNPTQRSPQILIEENVHKHCLMWSRSENHYYLIYLKNELLVVRKLTINDIGEDLSLEVDNAVLLSEEIADFSKFSKNSVYDLYTIDKAGKLQLVEFDPFISNSISFNIKTFPKISNDETLIWNSSFLAKVYSIPSETAWERFIGVKHIQDDNGKFWSFSTDSYNNHELKLYETVLNGVFEKNDIISSFGYGFNNSDVIVSNSGKYSSGYGGNLDKVDAEFEFNASHLLYLNPINYSKGLDFHAFDPHRKELFGSNYVIPYSGTLTKTISYSSGITFGIQENNSLWNELHASNEFFARFSSRYSDYPFETIEPLFIKKSLIQSTDYTIKVNDETREISAAVLIDAIKNCGPFFDNRVKQTKLRFGWWNKFFVVSLVPKFPMLYTTNYPSDLLSDGIKFVNQRVNDTGSYEKWVVEITNIDILNHDLKEGEFSWWDSYGHDEVDILRDLKNPGLAFDVIFTAKDELFVRYPNLDDTIRSYSSKIYIKDETKPSINFNELYSSNSNFVSVDSYYSENLTDLIEHLDLDSFVWDKPFGQTEGEGVVVLIEDLNQTSEGISNFSITAVDKSGNKSSPKVLRVEFLPEVTVNVMPEESGEIELVIISGSEVKSATIQATPSLGFLFNRWEGDATGNKNPLTFTFASRKNITAYFEADLRDSDEDGISNYQELTKFNTDPDNADSDFDSISDSLEIELGSDPLSSNLNVIKHSKNLGESNVLNNPNLYSLITISAHEKALSELSESSNEEINFFKNLGIEEGKNQVINNPTAYNLFTSEEYEQALQSLDNNVTPYTPSWFYIPDQGWMWTDNEVYPWIFDANSSNWMYFKSGHKQPRFYHYKSKSWMHLGSDNR